MRLLKFAIVWSFHLGIWTMLVADLSLRDFMIGLLATSLTSIAVWRVGGKMNVQFRPTIRQIAEAWRIPGSILTGTYQLLQAMRMQLFSPDGADSIVEAIPFDYGKDDARSAGRRALATTYTTITPNSIVLGWIRSSDRRESYMLLHQVKRDEVHQLTKNLGAHQ